MVFVKVTRPLADIIDGPIKGVMDENLTNAFNKGILLKPSTVDNCNKFLKKIVCI